MTKQVNKKIAALAMAAVMGVGGLGTAKLSQRVGLASANSGTHSSYSLHANTGTIGINQKAEVEVAMGQPATLTLDNVAAGQYMIVAKVIQVMDEYYWIDLSASVNDNVTYLSENEYLGAYIGTVMVDSDSTIQLGTYSDVSLVVEVWLQPLAIGQFNDYYLSDIVISADTPREIELEGISGEYFVIAETYDEMEPGAEIMVNGTALYVEPEISYALSALIDFTGTPTLKLETTNTEAISVNLSLRKYIEGDEVLPTEEYAKFELNEPQTFYYDAKETGYFSLSYTTDASYAEFSFIVKTNPNHFEGIAVLGENYPIYMETNVTYYIMVTLMSAPMDSETEKYKSVNAVFAVNKWEKPTLELDKDAVHVPVTTGDAVEIPLSVEAGTYDLNLFNIPLDVMFGGYTVWAHFGDNEVALDFGYAQIEITDETSIWFTTDYETGFAAGVTLNEPEVIEYIYLDNWTEISVPAGKSRVYYLEGVEDGYFNVILEGIGKASIEVDASTSVYPIISEGQTFGTFRVDTYGGDPVTIALYFYNHGEEEANFSAIVEVAEDAVIELGEATDIELAGSETKIYYLENLAEGLYNIAIENAEGVEVTVNGMTVADGRFTTNYNGESVAVRFTNKGDETAVVTVTVIMVADGVIRVGEDSYIMMDPESNIKTYMVEGLEAGTYNIKLSNYVTGVTVMMGDTVVIEAGATEGTFTVNAGESVILTFSYSGADFLYFNVLVS